MSEVASLPSWKLELIQRKRRQETSVERTTNSHTAGSKLDLSGVPGWKRDVILKKQLQQKGSNGLNGVNKNLNISVEKSVEIEHEPTNLLSNSTTADQLTAEERLLPITKNPILLLDLEKRHQSGSTGLDVETMRSDGSHSDRKSLSPNFTNNNSSNNCSFNPIISREDTEEVFQGEDNLEYGKGFVHRLLKRFSGLTGKEETVKCNGLLTTRNPRRSRSSGDMMHGCDENGEMTKEEVTKSCDDLLQEAPTSPNLIGESSRHYGSVPNGLSNLSFSVSGEGRGDLDDDVIAENDMPQENMVSNVRSLFEKFVAQPPGPRKSLSSQQINATSNNKITTSSFGRNGNTSATLPSLSNVHSNAQLVKNVGPSNVVSVERSTISDGKQISVNNTQNKASSRSNNTADMKTSSVAKADVKEVNCKVEATAIVAEESLNKNRSVNSTFSATPNHIMNHSGQARGEVTSENKQISVSAFAQQNKLEVSNVKRKQPMNVADEGINLRTVLAADIVSSGSEEKLKSRAPENDISKALNGSLVKPSSNHLSASSPLDNRNIKSATNQSRIVESASYTQPVVNQYATYCHSTLENSSTVTANNSQSLISQPTFSDSCSPTVTSSVNPAKLPERSSDDSSKSTGFSGEDATKRPGAPRPGKLLIRPASNLLGSNTKSEFLGLTKYNNVTKGEFAPPAARPLPPVTSELDDDDNVVDGGRSYVFIGGDVKLGRSLLVKTLQYSKLKLHFDDNAETFEYPSEQSLMDSMPAQPGDCDYVTASGAANSEDASGEDLEFSALRPAPGLTGSLGSLSSYQSRTQVNYQFGMYDSMEEVSQQQSASRPVAPEPKVESPPATSYSGTGSSDLLF